MSSNLDLLYKKQILEEAKTPYHFEKIAHLEHQERAYNPICGDRFDLLMDLEEDKLKAVYFDGFGCTISKASTSMMARILEGKSKEEAVEIASHFVEAIEKGKSSNIEGLEVFNEPKSFAGRKDCIQLSWKALKNYLEKL